MSERGGGGKESRRVSSSSERHFKVERAQKCLENAALVSKRIKEHRRAAAELLGKTFEDDDTCDVSSEMVSTVSTRTSYSVATDNTSAMSVEDALNIPGISESLANTLKQKEIIMERIKQYKERSKRPAATKSFKSAATSRPIGFVPDDEAQVVKTPLDALDITHLKSIIKEKETAISIMQVKMRAMETTVLDLQEKISEKDSLIEAKTKASSLMSDNLSKKEKDSLSLLEDTRQQMVKMQENFVAMETEWKEEKQRFLRDIEFKNERINHLEQANAILENSRFEISLAHAKLTEEIEGKNNKIAELQAKLENVSEVYETKEVIEEEKGSLEISNMVELTKRIELLEQLNCKIRQTNVELENKLATLHSESKTPEPTIQKKSSPQVARKRGKSASRNTSAKLKSPWSTLAESTSQDTLDKSQTKSDIKLTDAPKVDLIIQSLNKELVDKEFIISQKESVIQHQLDIISEKEKEIKTLINAKPETADIGLNCETPHTADVASWVDIEKDKVEILEKSADDKPILTMEELQIELNAAHEKVAALNFELEDSNKNMVKVKSVHKLKLKQMQKTIDSFSQMSDSNAEVKRLSEKVNQLTQKVAELEEDKGNLQLHLVDYDSGRISESEAHRKLTELEALAESRFKAISELETQKFDLVQELHLLQQKNSEMDDKLADLQQLENEQVCTEIKSVQLEEQLDQALAAKKELELITENLRLHKEQLKQTIKELQEKNTELTNKLQNYMQENMELTERLEKLSAEKVSSAESIEMVESLTIQEKLELEEYNRNMQLAEHTIYASENKTPTTEAESVEINDSLMKLSQESAELNQKIELFTQERHEVMENMSKLKLENEQLHNKIQEMKYENLQTEKQIQILNEEKDKIIELNKELNVQIGQLKLQRIEILQENSSLAKPAIGEDMCVEAEPISKDADSAIVDNLNQDDKLQGDKSSNKTKPAKQLTKDILKLKNVIKEREAEIADCQMKILSLEEQHQKLNDLVKKYVHDENTLKTLTEENCKLNEELSSLKHHSGLAQIQTCSDDIEKLKQSNEAMQKAVSNTQAEYQALISTRDARIQELEDLLNDYEAQISAYTNSLQEKDKDLTEYLNQITQLNSVSQKLKSTIEVLEEEKAMDKNGDIIKNMNKQIINLQTIIKEQENKINDYEAELTKITSVKVELKEKNDSLEKEMRMISKSLVENETRMKGLQELQDKHDSEVLEITNQWKERDEEIHEIKLQLRKESIENDNLRKSLVEVDSLKSCHKEELNNLNQKYEDVILKYNELSQNYGVLETKNKELMDKLKKFAVNLKKKTMICSDLEGQVKELNKQIELKQMEVENLLANVNSSAAVHDQVALLSKELECLKSEGLSLEQNKIHDLEAQVAALLVEKSHLIHQNEELENKWAESKQEVESALINKTSLINELEQQRQQSQQLKSNIDALNNKLVEYEIEQKNNLNFITKISGLESDVHQKQLQISNLLHQIENIQHDFNTFKFGHEAKLQERDLFIENLESDICNYRNRIARLEESISVMEDRRHSMERKADQLGNQLEEKHKSYSDYTVQEDELINRLAVLMDHDQVVEKQLHEIERENSELQNKMQKLIDDNQNLQNKLTVFEHECSQLKETCNQMQQAELDGARAQQNVDQLEAQIKKISAEHQVKVKKQQEDMNYIETEFNVQIENSIKEKKALIEKFEKTAEHNRQLEQQLQHYADNNKVLTQNLEELGKRNKNIESNSQAKEESEKKDYTEQYVNEINNLQSIINKNNSYINELQSHSMKLQAEHNTTISNFQIKFHMLNESREIKDKEIEILKNELQHTKALIQSSHTSVEQLKAIITDLQNQVCEKDNLLKSLTNVEKSDKVPQPMVASITEVSPTKQFDSSSLEAQIVVEGPQTKEDDIEHDIQKITKDEKTTTTQGLVEEIIVPIKTYLCYDDESKEKVVDEPKLCSESEVDPFNSEEGWGLEENMAEAVQIKYDYSQLISELKKLSTDNEKLKTESANANMKLAKAMKKLKELKMSNDRLINELKTANQVSQFNMLDTTIEDELKNQVKELDEKIVDMTTCLAKEKREKHALLTQNEVFKNANDRLMDMKEKLENEIEMWKYKFKEANDRVSTFEWTPLTQGPGVNESLQQKQHHHEIGTNVMKDKSLIEQLEKENDELNLLVDQLTKQNKNYSTLESRQKDEIVMLNKEISKIKSEWEKQHVDSNKQKLSLKSSLAHTEESKTCEKCETNSRDFFSLKTQYEDANVQNEFLKSTINQLNLDINAAICKMGTYENDNIKLQNEIIILKESLNRAQEELLLASAAATFEQENIQLTEKCKYLENDAFTMKSELDNNIIKIEYLQTHLNTANEKLLQYETQIADFEKKILKLNEENDQLLSTVAELRSSMSSAVDQRGYEVAEMWKQHLAQRETDFADMEHELREQISAAEFKYNHLLDSVQSSTQEETNKLVMIEQMSSIQAKLKDKEEHFASLQNKCSQLVSDLEMLRSEMVDEQLIQENKLMGQQEYYEKQLSELRNKNIEDLTIKESKIFELESEINKIKIVKHDNETNLSKSCQMQIELDELRSEIISTQQASEKEVARVKEICKKELEELSQQLINKDLTIAMLKSAVEENKRSAELKENEDEILFYKQKCTQLESELDNLKSYMVDKAETHEKESLIQHELYQQQLVELRSQNEGLTNTDSKLAQLRIELDEQRQVIRQLQADKEELSSTMDTLRNKITELMTQIQLKDSEIYQKTQEYNIVLQQRSEEFETLRQQLVEYERKVEELSFEKESELAILRLKLHDQSSNFEKEQVEFRTENAELMESLTLKIDECTKLSKEIRDLKISLEENSVQMSEMRTVLEAQELEIVTLKDEIDNMQVLLESSMSKIEKHVTFAAGTKSGSDQEHTSESDEVKKELLEGVPRAELDLALYMLHQRDMRCEELTVELTHLLEERDTLQLRLSDCLRSYEELRSTCNSAGVEVPVSEIQEDKQARDVKEQRLVGTHKPSTSRRNSVSEPTDEKPNLQTKLWEVRSLRQGRDVRLRQDSERRELDMQLLQRDVSRLPTAAADQLRQAHYTLSRDSQSASTVLLNWLKGKSTPKVVHM